MNADPARCIKLIPVGLFASLPSLPILLDELAPDADAERLDGSRMLSREGRLFCLPPLLVVDAEADMRDRMLLASTSESWSVPEAGRAVGVEEVCVTGEAPAFIAAAAMLALSNATGLKPSLGALPINMVCKRWSARVAVLIIEPGTHLSHFETVRQPRRCTPRIPAIVLRRSCHIKHHE